MFFKSLKSKLTIFSFLIVSSGFSAASFAADSCNALLTIGIYNIQQSSNASEGNAMAKSNFCSYDYSLSSINSSQKAAIKASFMSWFSGGASGAVIDSQIIQTQKSVCISGYNSSAYSKSASDYSYAINQDALTAWSQCNALNASAALQFEVQMDNSLQGMVVSLSTSPGTIGEFIGVSQTGTGTSVCTAVNGTTGAIIPVVENTAASLSSAKKFAITCKRDMQSDGKGNLFADAQTFFFNTSAGSYQVPLAKIGLLARSSVEEIKTAVNNDVQTSLTNLNTTLSQTNTIISGLQSNVGTLNKKASSISYGGSYLMRSGKYLPGCVTSNSLTGSCSCPTGYSAREVARGYYYHNSPWDSYYQGYNCEKQ